ncbi:hypothetical protein BLNAU_19214 [Blattamonas nauphoetae]|uniref:Uncharacterized protein n=1 Tax=Blattamonas nauphoetae TaxID=2049346 RepID=A0ABQ9X244_9EUKA|nr:hypothetical protein BLNAU_19214 [Blattamonas nauphoetae]
MVLLILSLFSAVFPANDPKILSKFNLKPLIKEPGKVYETSIGFGTVKWNFRTPFEGTSGTSCAGGDCIIHLSYDDIGTCTCFGKDGTETYNLLGSNNGLCFMYSNGPDGDKTVRYDLVCAKQEHLSAESPNGTYIQIEHQSPYGCMKSAGLGWGWIFVIVLFGGLLLLFIIGIPVNKCIRKKTGIEVIPFFIFWSSLPRMTLEGIKCLFSPCRRKRQGFEPQ